MQLPLFVFVWLLWSVKESAYKYLQRNSPDLVFSPTKIIVKNIFCPDGSKLFGNNASLWDSSDNSDAYYCGYAIYGDSKVYFRSIINTDWLTSTVSGDGDFENVYWGMKMIGSTEYAVQSSEAKVLLLDKLNAFYPGYLTIEKRGTPYPSVFKDDDDDLNIPVSLSHDGGFIAYAFIAQNKFIKFS